MTTDTEAQLGALEKRLMEGAQDRWYVCARDKEEGRICVDTSVANPGWENYWVLIWASPETATVRILSKREEGGHWLEAEYEMSVDDLIEYLHQLPRPIQSFNATHIDSGIAQTSE